MVYNCEINEYAFNSIHQVSHTSLKLRLFFAQSGKFEFIMELLTIKIFRI